MFTHACVASPIAKPIPSDVIQSHVRPRPRLGRYLVSQDHDLFTHSHIPGAPQTAPLSCHSSPSCPESSDGLKIDCSRSDPWLVHSLQPGWPPNQGVMALCPTFPDPSPTMSSRVHPRPWLYLSLVSTRPMLSHSRLCVIVHRQSNPFSDPSRATQ